MRRREFITLLGGAAAAWPLAASAQQGERMRRIGVLAAHERHVPEFEGLREQLRELGYVEGKNLLIEWRYAAQGTAQLPILAKELVDLHPDIIVAITTPATAAVKGATGSIPIVFANVGDPVGTGFVASDIAKQQGAQGLIVVPDPVTSSHRSAIIELAAKTRMPTMYGQREYVDDGGLMAYGPNYRAVFRRAAIYVDKILKGTQPADLPVEQPTKFELVINLKTARALGLTVPNTLLVAADEVIE